MLAISSRTSIDVLERRALDGSWARSAAAAGQVGGVVRVALDVEREHRPALPVVVGAAPGGLDPGALAEHVGHRQPATLRERPAGSVNGTRNQSLA